ncbi:MAG: hypothetical protein M3Y31_00840, partial [Gemmatimonadota bacterium]|nr:hypothetical protein [Gemmatimonadota bacterium]
MRLALRSLAAAGVAAAALVLLTSSGPAAVEGAPDRHTRVMYDQSRGVVEFLIGPFDLPGSGEAHQHGHAGAFLPPITTVDIPADVRIYGAEYDLVDADGRVLPTELL